MKKLSPITFSLILGMGMAAAIATAADKTPLIPAVDVLQNLNQAGYNQIYKIEYKNDVYKVQAYGSQGQKVKFDVNAKDMVIPPIEANSKSYLTMLQVARKLQGAGYTHIDQIEFNGNYYAVKSYNANGDRIKLDVDSITGEIHKN